MRKFSTVVWFFLAAGIVAAGFLGYFSYKERERERKINVEMETLRQEAEKIRSANRNLKEKIAYFETPEFQESVAKEKLNLQKPDEQVIVVKPDDHYDTEFTESMEVKEDETVKSESNYIKWWKKFFNH